MALKIVLAPEDLSSTPHRAPSTTRIHPPLRGLGLAWLGFHVPLGPTVLPVKSRRQQASDAEKLAVPVRGLLTVDDVLVVPEVPEGCFGGRLLCRACSPFVYNGGGFFLKLFERVLLVVRLAGGLPGRPKLCAL